MSNEEDQVEDLIEQLKSLQIKQASILVRLDKARNKEQVDVLGTFAIGDRVRVLNPRPLQATRGKIVKISRKFITIETASGNTISRIPKNLSIEK
jgi:preprotein translocase subunit YajC